VSARIRVCSGFSPSGRIQYGDRFLRSFDLYWPAEVELLVYVEESTMMPRGAERFLWSIPGAREFHDRHLDSPAVHGREARPCWKAREAERGYSFKTDAFKFWKQILIPAAAAADPTGPLEDGDILLWLDGDVETTAPVPLDLVPRLLGDAEVVFLGRTQSHSEIGFWAVRLNSRTRQFLHDIALVYSTDAFLELPEWHSAYVWDSVRLGSGLKERNLCKPGLRGHVWPMTQLARYMRHDKGRRKP
jgi:hypothetical protein